MHQRRGLIGNGLHQPGMAMAQQIDGDAAGKVEIALAALPDQIAALASDRTHIAPGVNGHERRNRHVPSLSGLMLRVRAHWI